VERTASWHRDALTMELLGKKTKSFAVGGLYVNIPKNIGGNIQFKRNNKFYSMAPKSGTSVLFIDDELFHKVTDINPPPGVRYLPRSAMFILYGTDTQSFKRGLAEHRITKGDRNYENAYKRMSQNLKNKLNRVINNPSLLKLNVSNVRKSNENFALNIQKQLLISELNRYARNVFNTPNATHKNLITLYSNMKKAFGTGNTKLNSSFISITKERSPRVLYGMGLRRSRS
jgi:hypothetical protein